LLSSEPGYDKQACERFARFVIDGGEESYHHDTGEISNDALFTAMSLVTHA